MISLLDKNYITARLQGRTGNMMFQIAHAYCKSLEYNRQLVIPSEESSSKPFENNLFRKVDFSITRCPDEYHVHAPFTYLNVEPNLDKPTVFVGWFQSEKYFGKYTEAVRGLFSPPLDFINRVISDYPFFKDDIVAAINVRRGDYLTQPTRHPVVTLEYIMEAVNKLPYYDHLLVMSDDMEWCKENIKLPKVIFNDPSKYWDHEGLWLLSLCNHFIISNSTFSWWGAWLSTFKDKVVIAPSTWFGPDIIREGLIADDVYGDSWVKIPTKWDNGFIVLE